MVSITRTNAEKFVEHFDNCRNVTCGKFVDLSGKDNFLSVDYDKKRDKVTVGVSMAGFFMTMEIFDVFITEKFLNIVDIHGDIRVAIRGV